jgi:hypothetical protein
MGGNGKLILHNKSYFAHFEMSQHSILDYVCGATSRLLRSWCSYHKNLKERLLSQQLAVANGSSSTLSISVVARVLDRSRSFVSHETATYLGKPAKTFNYAEGEVSRNGVTGAGNSNGRETTSGA